MEARTFAQRASDWICGFCGSWPFVIFFVVFTAIWIGLNAAWLTLQFDPYPFILLNLFFTVVELFQGPLIMMSQNRQAQRERTTDLATAARDREAVAGIHAKLDLILAQRQIRSVTPGIPSERMERKAVG